MPRNWKTTFLGVAGLISLVAKIFAAGFDPTTDVTAGMTALGLIAARDHNNHATIQSDDAHRRLQDRS